MGLKDQMGLGCNSSGTGIRHWIPFSVLHKTEQNKTAGLGGGGQNVKHIGD